MWGSRFRVRELGLVRAVYIRIRISRTLGFVGLHRLYEDNTLIPIHIYVYMYLSACIHIGVHI